jgi:FkbM family methyltransferase
MNKLEGLPRIHYISLEESIERRTNLENWFKKYNIMDYVPHLFKRFEEYDYKLVGPYVNSLAPHSKGPITSHFTLLKHWYETTDESYTLIVEDDLSLAPVDYWNFTWKDFFESLPEDWNCVQLVLVREHLCENYSFEKRRERDWCAAAFLIKREYVKLLLDSYYFDDYFNLDIKGLEYPPVIEHLLFTNKPGVYCFPLFAEDCYNTQSSLLPENAHAELINGQGPMHHFSYDCVMNWWKTKGKSLNINQIFEEDLPFNYKNLKKKYNLNINGIIHVGAHYGEEVSDYIESGVQDIILFEPLQDNFNVLSNRMKNLNANILLHNVALGSILQKSIMYVSDNEAQSSSILVPNVHLTHHPNVNFPDIEEVSVDVLDNFDCGNSNYLHMDVQGYELEVLKGATETLKHIDYVLCEVNRDELYEGNAYVEEIDEFLKQYGMERVETYWMGDIWGDALYIKKNAYDVSKTCQIQNLSSIYQKYFGYPYNGFFIEVGAYDGESFSNTSCLADCGWKGIYVEPISKFYSQCLERHKNNDVLVVQCSIGSEEKESDIYVCEGLTTSNEKLVEMYSEIDWSKDYVFYKDKCNQIRLETLLQNQQVNPEFDLLVVDVEGNEESVFNSFDLEYWSPKMLIVELIDEHHSFQKYSDHIESNKNLRSKILSYNYIEVYKDEINTIFVKKDLYNKNN